MANTPVALVTGGSSGIGKAASLVFAQKGCKVCVVGRSEEKGGQTVKEIKDAGGQAEFVRCDVASESDVKDMVAFVKDKFGRLDYAFINSGVEHSPTYIHETSMEDFDFVMNVNVLGVFACMKYAIPLMLATSDAPSIVVTASVAGHGPLPCKVAYSTSKWAVRGLVATAAKEYGKLGLRVNAVAPGWVVSQMTDNMDWDGMFTKVVQGPSAGLELKKDKKNGAAEAPAAPGEGGDVKAVVKKLTKFTADSTHTVPDSMMKNVAMGRVGQPDEIAQLVVWLCQEGSYITGQSLVIDGGQLCNA